jgi:type I restriction enzyme M protein
VEPSSLREQAKHLVDRLRSSGLSSRYLRDVFTVAVLLRWADYQEAEEEAMAEFEDRQWRSVLPPRLRWGVWFRLPPSEVGRILFHELPAYLAGVRSRSDAALAVYLSALSEPLQHLATTDIGVVCDVVHWVGEQPLETSNDRHLFLEFFDSLLAETVESREGQFVSPQSIAKLAVAIADPRPGDRVYDPCFGFGSFLTAAWEYADRNPKIPHGRRSGTPISVFGVEINSSAYLIGLTRLILAGDSNPHLECGNSLEREPAAGQNGQGFDVVLANPPIGARFADEAWRYGHFPIRTKDSTSLFVQHVLSQLGKQGRAVIAVPEGFLFRGGQEQELRRYLVEHGHLDAVIALPEGAFAPHTMVRGSLLVLRKEGRMDQVRMVDARSFFRKAEAGRAVVLPSQQLEKLVTTFRETWVLPDDEVPKFQATVNLAASPLPKPKVGGRQEEESILWAVSVRELSATDFDLTPRRREKGRLEDLLSALRDALRDTGTIAQLHTCAAIFAGRSIPSKDLTTEPAGERPTPYIRIRDIRKGVVNEGSNWIRPAALTGLEPQSRLLAGDVLLSKSGTIGKAGIVRNGAVGAVAANGLYAVRVDKDSLDPHFLLAYLGSPACQNWLTSRSRGAVIRHLNRSVFDELPIPIPPISLQHRAAMQFREHGTDVIQFLLQALEGSEQDPIASWVADVLRQLPITVETISDPLALAPVESLAESVRPVRNRAAHAEIKSPLVPWILSFAEGLKPLHGLGQIPKGPSLLSLIQESSRALRSAQELVKGFLPVEAQARALNDLLLGWFDRAANALLREVNIVLTANVSVLQLGEPAEVVVSIENRGVLPLRDLGVLTSPDWGQGSFGFVGENQTIKLSLRGESPKVPGLFSLTASWSAQTLDGQSIRGDRQLSFTVISGTARIAETADLGSNPYVTGTPVYPERNDVFFGRETLLGQISRQIVSSGNVALLEGNRRAGKTSVLRHLEGTAAIPGWLGVYCSLQGAEGTDAGVGVPTAEIFRGMATSIGSALVKLNIEAPLPNGTTIPAGKPALGVGRACREGISEASPFTDFRDYLEIVLETLKERGLGIVMMLDEFDKLQEGIDHGVTSPQVPENIRFLVQSYPRFSAILTGSRRLKRLREEYWSALYGLGTRFGITALDPDEARRLVVEPVKGKLTFSPEAVDRAISITACQPYLLQVLCNRIFDFSAQTRTRSITLDTVEQASAALVKDNEHFASLWDYAASYRRRLILMLCSQRSGASEQVSFGELQELLTQNGIELTNEELDADLSHLRELELVDLVGKIGDAHYQLAIPLMGAWIETHQDFDVILRNAQAESEEDNV